jgi:hypothetical protein
MRWYSGPEAFGDVRRVNVNGGAGKVTQTVQELVVHLIGDLVPGFHCELRVYGNIQFCVQPVA